ncbi:MAG: sensor histidine kinase, partial [Acidobacteria bacterium]
HLATTVNQTLHRLEAAFVAIREFATDASHQLQTPLAVMKSSLEFADRRIGIPHEELLAQLSAGVTEMSAVLADLQALALADADLAGTRSGLVNFSETCAEALEIVTALAESSEIVVEARIQPAIQVWGDPVRLRQVVLNLGDNAVKYTGEGGRVQLSLTHNHSNAVLQVTDTGKGVDPQHLPHIFERFYRADRRASDAAGTGLGLAIVKRIVEVHRGSIEVSSRPGQGSTFTVTLPLSSHS